MTVNAIRDALLPWAASLRPARAGDWLSENVEPGQSLAQFRAALKPRSVDRTNRVFVFWIDDSSTRPSDEVIAQLARIIHAYFPGVVTCFPDPPEALASATRSVPRRSTNAGLQVCSQSLVRVASETCRAEAPSRFAVVLLTGSDLYYEGNDPEDWLFGLADSEKGGLCVSWNRCGVDGPASLTTSRRFVGVLLHELCHLFYLQHCVSFDCLMNGVNDLTELDAQSMHLCPECHAKLFDVIRFDPIDRFASLRQLFEELSWKRDASVASNLLSRLKERTMA